METEQTHKKNYYTLLPGVLNGTGGFITIPREFFNTPIFHNPNALKIFLWLLQKAGHKPQTVSLKIGKDTITVNLKRGQLLFGKRATSKELNIKPTTIYDWIQKFEQDGILSTKGTDQKRTIITISFYDRYQPQKIMFRPPTDHQKPHLEPAKPTVNTGISETENFKSKPQPDPYNKVPIYREKVFNSDFKEESDFKRKSEKLYEDITPLKAHAVFKKMNEEKSL